MAKADNYRYPRSIQRAELADIELNVVSFYYTRAESTF